MVDVRLPTAADFDLMFLWRNHESVREYSRNTEPIPIEDHRLWVHRVNTKSGVRVLMLTVNSERIGVGRLDISDHAAEFSIYLAPDFMGKRLGVAALRALLRYGFEGLGLHLIWGETSKDNDKAQRTFLKAGMNRRDNGAWVRFDMSRAEWKALSRQS